MGAAQAEGGRLLLMDLAHSFRVQGKLVHRSILFSRLGWSAAPIPARQLLPDHVVTVESKTTFMTVSVISSTVSFGGSENLQK
ncbi:hypothetical protein AX760_24665 [Pararhizobium antarcticum]|uniref:Uncharacterized protein n=1 Tax=Pararhizobium antarcticum TaxID=1798805 RepID=A0A657LLR2_9HYPH|nr:hypothetical protein AX760_24665 [Pararhizobium antarcticum]